MVIDAHHHLQKDPDYAKRLAEQSMRLKIDKTCVFGAGRRSLEYGMAANKEVIKAAEMFPDLFIPFACFDLGYDMPDKIKEFKRDGFQGVKFINPAKNYDDKDFYPVYAAAEEEKLLVIFHLGIVSRSPVDHLYDVNNERHRAIYLDTIARAFPNLTIIGAHLGNPWYEEAAMAARWNPNLYFDLSGSTLKCKSPEFLGTLLWWSSESRYKDLLGRGAWEKIVFGSDVGYQEIDDVMNDYSRTMNALNVPQEIQAKVFGGTMAQLLGIGEIQK
ncbi:MAG: amidohydrolase family protein [Candidatus Ratteibacteria bacterium]|jgi:predicted TIM-barrel fold metal-dependent hydrolase